MIINLASDTNKQLFAAASETVSAFQKFLLSHSFRTLHHDDLYHR